MTTDERSAPLTLVPPAKCRDCGDEAHEPGQSKRSNCGESEVLAPGGYYDVLPPRFTPSRYYTANGRVRREFRR